MKKANGYAATIQLIVFLFMAIYFLGFRDVKANAETDQRVKAGINEYKIEVQETIGNDLQVLKNDMQVLKINMKRSLEAQDLTWIE